MMADQASARDRRTVRLTCPAKVNLALRVGRPAANCLHPIASWMVALHFGDDLVLRNIAGQDGDLDASRFDIGFSPDVPLSQAVDWPLDRDLGFRAHALLERQAGRPLPIELSLHKHIPAGAGLGGGSSNAAGVLVGVNRLFELNLSCDELTKLAMELGSDVAFLVYALMGRPSAVVEGFGERITPVETATTMHVVLIFPPVHCNTGGVYRAFDEMNPDAPARPDEAQVYNLARAAFIEQAAPFNDLAAPALRAYPKLAEIHGRVEREIGMPVHVTGSGSTLFVLGAGDTSARLVARRISELTGLPTVVARSMAARPAPGAQSGG